MGIEVSEPIEPDEIWTPFTVKGSDALWEWRLDGPRVIYRPRPQIDSAGSARPDGPTTRPDAPTAI